MPPAGAAEHLGRGLGILVGQRADQHDVGVVGEHRPDLDDHRPLTGPADPHPDLLRVSISGQGGTAPRRSWLGQVMPGRGSRQSHDQPAGQGKARG